MNAEPEELSAAEHEQLQEFFDSAADLPAVDQAQFLKSIEEDSPAIAAHLRSMLLREANRDESCRDLERTVWQGQTDDADRCVEGYEILEELGRGGMGIVYKARQLNPDRVVALKMIRFGKFASETDVKRFAAEVDAIAKLDHENIVSIFEIGAHRGEHFFTMQLIEGSRFDAYLESASLDRHLALRILSQICRAVAFCHQRGIVHRDLKPSNILLDQNNNPKLTDFGLAKHLEQESHLTRTGDLMGTPGYMAPEQASGDRDVVVDARADVYSLGAILYKLLTGKPPIDVSEVNLAGAVQRIRSNDVVVPSFFDRRIPRDLETICMKCLDADPDRRYQNAGELTEELQRFLEGEPIHARPISLFRRFLRWSRQQPGLAVTWIGISLFYAYHLCCKYLLGIPTSDAFHLVSTLVAISWVTGAFLFQKLLVQTRGARPVLFGWVSMEVVLLTIVLLFGESGESSLLNLYLVLVAASVLRFQPVLVAYVTCLCIVAYLFQMVYWRILARGDEGIAAIEGASWIPMTLCILCVGLIQYYALRRSQTVMELIAKRPV